eukprot:6590338-Karenia_brevis.AAC.1
MQFHLLLHHPSEVVPTDGDHEQQLRADRAGTGSENIAQCHHAHYTIPELQQDGRLLMLCARIL